MALKEYRCSEGHYCGSYAGELKKCPQYLKGKACTGSLKPIGAGSRTKKVPA